jgi:hypothetical protein
MILPVSFAIAKFVQRSPHSTLAAHGDEFRDQDTRGPGRLESCREHGLCAGRRGKARRINRDLVAALAFV